MALARLLAWYVFRFGRRQLDNQAAAHGMSQRRLGWEIAWKPVLMLMVMIYAIVGIPLGWMWFQEKRTIAALPVVTVDDTATTTRVPVCWWHFRPAAAASTPGQGDRRHHGGPGGVLRLRRNRLP